MAHLTDETLMAYADGELDPTARARVEVLIAENPQSRERLKIFTSTGAPVAAAFDDILDEPVPAHLSAFVMNARIPSQAAHQAPAGGLVSSVADAIAKLFSGGPSWVPAAAWSVPAVLLVAGGALWFSQRSEITIQDLVVLQEGQIYAQGQFRQALETTLSGTSVALSGGEAPITMKTVMTFKNRRQTFCRQYDVTASDSGYAGIACRTGDGQWRLDVHVASTQQAPAGERIVPAGKGPSSVEAAVGNIIDGDALGQADETTLIHGNWRR